MSTVSEAEILDHLLSAAKKAGAETADASVSSAQSLSVDVRLGQLEGVEREDARSAALRIMIGRQQASATSSDVSPAGLAALAARVAEMARAAPQDKFCGLLEARYRDAGGSRDLGLTDDAKPSPAELERLALAAEEAALAQPGVTNSAGAGAGYGKSRAAYATSDGFFGLWEGGSYSLSISALAESAAGKERDYDYRTVRKFADLPTPESLGVTAGSRAAARLGGRKIESRRAPVILENRVATRILSPALGAITGAAIARGVSFLKDKLGTRVFAEGIVLAEDPLRIGGMASRPFDGEGGAVKARNLFDDGVLTTWLMNSSSARQLGLEPTGHGTLGHGGPPGTAPSNLTLAPRRTGGLDDLIGEAGACLLVTEMFSPSLNGNTGDYSVGVAGFWCENGKRVHPVNEVTIAGNLIDFYGRLIPGGDLERRSSFDSPSILIDDVAIAGI